MSNVKILIIAVITILMSSNCCYISQKHPIKENGTLSEKAAAIDLREIIPSDEFRSAKKGVWISDLHKTEIPFNEMIYSWQVKLTSDEGFRLYIQVTFQDGEQSPWLYAGYWGKVDLVESRTNPTFEYGTIEMDILKIEKPAEAYQFKISDKGNAPLENIPSINTVLTLNNPNDRYSNTYKQPVQKRVDHSKILDLPLRLQIDSEGNPTPNRCQSAALATALEYYGASIPLEKIIDLIYDTEYRYPGIWPRVIAAATQLGFDAYIDRFRDWIRVKQALKENKVILCSITLPPDGNYIAPPYPSIGGHIVALNGITDDGRVIVTDSALGKNNAGFRCQWIAEDFEKAWFRTKGGVAMVIVPPRSAKAVYVRNLPAFPRAIE